MQKLIEIQYCDMRKRYSTTVRKYWGEISDYSIKNIRISLLH